MSIGLYDMAKRKRDIFTVREAVPNWFEASEGNTEYFEVVGDLASNYVATDTGEEAANRDPLPCDTALGACVANGRGRKAANGDQLLGSVLSGVYVASKRLLEPVSQGQSQWGATATSSWDIGTRYAPETSNAQPFRPTLAVEAIGWLGSCPVGGY